MEDPIRLPKDDEDHDDRKKVSINTFMAIPFLGLNFYDTLFFAIYCIITVGLLIYKTQKLPMPQYAINTEVVILEAQLLGIEDLGDAYMASVEFSGMIREEPSAGPSPFREVWNMTKPKSGASGWLVAGVQALQ